MDTIDRKRWPATKNVDRPITGLKPHPRNTKQHPDSQIDVIAGLIQKYGWTNRVLIDGKNRIIAGHGRVLAAKKLGITTIPCALAEGWSDADIRAYLIADNKSAESPWDEDLLGAELKILGDEGIDLASLGFSDDELSALLGDEEPPRPPSVPLTDRFGVVPFSVLNAREGWWQDRKRAWLALGIRSEVGRGDNLLKMSDTALEPDPKKRAKMQADREKRKSTKVGQQSDNGGANAEKG